MRDSTAPAREPHGGWYLAAFSDELPEPVTPLSIGSRRLIAVRGPEGIRMYDGTCPHRGASLGHGGRTTKDCTGIICPFHGKRIGLGDGPGRYTVAEHPVLHAGDAVFVRLGAGPRDDRGFELKLKEILDHYAVVSAFARPVGADGQLVIENAFDSDHFREVHMVPRVLGMLIRPGEGGELAIEGEFRMRPPDWVREHGVADIASRFTGRAFSPSLAVTELDSGDGPYLVITGTVPSADGRGCVARVAFGIRPDRLAARAALTAGAHRAFDEDTRVWNELDADYPAHYDGRDQAVIAFRRFCRGFAPADGEAA